MTADLRSPQPDTAGGPDLGAVLREYMDATARLQRTHEALQREIVRLRRELASKDRELELRRRLAVLGELAAGVAHEVRNPLGAIQLYSGLLRTQCARHQLGPALELIAKIEAGVEAIDAVVQDTLALAPRDRQVRPCRLADVLARAGDAAAGVLAARQVSLEVAGADPPVRVQADPDGLQRVLLNLIVNAAEASPPGGRVRVEVSAGTGPEVEVRVLDRGPGLPEEIRHRIFDPFFTTKPHGTGLGLTIAHRLIEAYGGRLSAGNRPQGGAQFVLALPRAADGGGEREQPAPAGDARQFSAA